MARQRTYLEVKKIYPAGRIGGSDGVGKSWFQCRVCNGRGSSRNYDLKRTDEKQIGSCGCVERSLNAAYELREVQAMTPAAQKNIVSLVHKTRSTAVTAEQTGRRKVTIDLLIRLTRSEEHT